jgi:hypothetical protein
VKDTFIVVTLVLAFALFVTAHVAVTYGLATREPRWRAAVGFFFAPLGVYWAWRGQMRVRAGAAGVALLLYVLAIMVARV